MHEAVLARLVADPDLGSMVADRVAWGRQDPTVSVRPYINLLDAGTVPQYSLDGIVERRVSRVQVDVWADDAVTAKAVGALAEATLAALSGGIGGVVVRGCWRIASRFLSDDAPIGGGAKLRGWSFDVRMVWRESDI